MHFLHLNKIVCTVCLKLIKYAKYAFFIFYFLSRYYVEWVFSLVCYKLDEYNLTYYSYNFRASVMTIATQ